MNLSFRETSELLKKAERFHRFFEERCRELEDQSDGERLKMVLDYLSAQNQSLAQALKRFKEEGGAELQKTWFQYSPDQDPERCLSSVENLPADIPAESLVKRAIELQKCLGGFYSEAARLAPNESVTEMFEFLSKKSLRAREDLMAGMNLNS